MLLKRNLKKNFYCFILVFFVLYFAAGRYLSYGGVLISPDGGFILKTSDILLFTFVIQLSFLLYENYEIELALVCGVSTVRLMLTKFFSVLFYVIAGYSVILFIFYKYIPYENYGDEYIRVFVPENFRFYVLFSVVVTVLFYSSIILLVRVITRNCFVPIITGMFCFMGSYYVYPAIIHEEIDISYALIDPHISLYFIGDTVAIEDFGLYPIWTCNRLLFLALALIMLTLSVIIMRREKLHYSHNDV